MINSYKLVLAYDGTDYHGWQRQKNLRTIELVLRKIFLRSFHQKEIFLVGASRTDTGVHARGQVVRIGTPLPLCPKKIPYVLNKSLPQSMRIVSCEQIFFDFHPQHNVQSKTYTYTFSLQKVSPMISRYVWECLYKVDLVLLNEALAVFVGTHDFRAFVKEESDKDTIRTIKSIVLTQGKEPGTYVITFQGKTFLRYMIRRIVGAAFAVATRSDVSIALLKKQLAGEALCLKVLITAPAQGLCLESIEYENKAIVTKEVL